MTTKIRRFVVSIASDTWPSLCVVGAAFLLTWGLIGTLWLVWKALLLAGFGEILSKVDPGVFGHEVDCEFFVFLLLALLSAVIWSGYKTACWVSNRWKES